MSRVFPALASLLGLVVATSPLDGCDSTSGPGSDTGAVCPPASTLTWTNFGSAFMTHYCTRCHSNFRNQTAVQRDEVIIDNYAASGPSATNTGMPTSSPKPTAAERAKLGEWLSCGAP